MIYRLPNNAFWKKCRFQFLWEGRRAKLWSVGIKGRTEITGEVIGFNHDYQFYVIIGVVISPNRPRLMLYFDREGQCLHNHYEGCHYQVRNVHQFEMDPWSRTYVDPAIMELGIDFGKDLGTVVTVSDVDPG